MNKWQKCIYRWLFYVKTEGVVSYTRKIKKQIECNNLVFDGLCIVFVEDLLQLPPVLVEILWFKGLPNAKIDDTNGHTIYTHFNDVVGLKENNRLDETDSENVQFNLKQLIGKGR